MGGWIRSVELSVDGVDTSRYPFDLPFVASLGRLALHDRVTFFVGENGSGKSTLVEAIAVAAGFNAEGGSRNFNFATRDSTSVLHEYLTVEFAPGQRPRTDFFLRAESFYNVANEIEALEGVQGGLLQSYGGRSLHDQSHGESHLSLVLHRFGRDGLYLMDEPEAAMSPQGCLALLRRIHELVRAGSQFLIATHSPLLIAYPDADVWELDDDGLTLTPYRETRTFELFRSFTDAPDRYLRALLTDD